MGSRKNRLPICVPPLTNILSADRNFSAYPVRSARDLACHDLDAFLWLPRRKSECSFRQTAWTLLHKLRSGLSALPAPLLEGDIEADETYIGGYLRGWNGRGAGNVGVAIAVERRGRTAGCIRLAVIPGATTAVLTSLVKGAIVPQAATVHTDAWAAYRALSKMGIDHRPRKGGHGRHAEDGLPWAHTVFGNLKTWLRGAYYGVSPKHLQRYLNEFQFRFNQRWHEADLFLPVLHAAIAADPFPYRHLTAQRTG
jgi:transposase-like protein